MRISGTEDGTDTPSPGERSRAEGRADGKVSAPLRVDAQRNLRHVLSAARDVFGEQGYGAPMEEVARRARVGVGTVYRRFPNKEALVRHIAAEETQRLTDRALEALALDDEPWRALARFVRRSAASGAGRLLPPELLSASATGQEEPGGWRVPAQRSPVAGDGEPADEARPGTRELLAVVGELVERTRAAGELRADVTVADLMLVIATTPPRFEDAARQTAAESRLLEILLQGLRANDR
ncbi:TetR/AcrR family transcriptional regulator [Streptomyces litchfieldiae]|uniref:Helix-turn-helix domain-containing protein n=1 Tax=Streptomyces litchfieldiae TaxID=3075543 RepID=A0ABU2N4K8_9ACTN|nr:helix-turn-helix domain-containing protein [Streptomyces sp. DSM 44938]MDT0347664.1 helix-turn-helix domain-containing protein [Streptomyces sp. DSM 44938]